MKNIGFGFYFKKVKTQVSVAKHLSKRASKPSKSLAFGGLNTKFEALLATESAEKSIFPVKSHHFQMMILSDWRIIFRNGRRFLLLTCQRTITSLIFPTGIIYWENWIHLWALIFGTQNFPVWHMFLKCRSRAYENESQRTKRGFFSKQTNIQKPLLVCT